MSKIIDMSADLGEGFGNYKIANDDEMIDIISSANIACGFHAGDPRTMERAVKKSIKSDVGIGAHPGYPDLVGFGRRNMELTYKEIKTDILYQVGALDSFLKINNGKIQHVFPHGQLGLRANEDKTYAEAIVEGVALYDDELIIMSQKGELAECAKKKGLRVANPIFADRAYDDKGMIVPRNLPGAVIEDIEEIIQRTIKMVLEQKVMSVSGKEVNVEGHTLLVHGDTKGSVEIASRVRESLISENIMIKPLGSWLT